MTRKTITVLSLIIACAIITGCSNTFEGVGRDVENTGKWVQDTF